MADEDHDLLIRLDTKMDILIKQFDQHIAHHNKLRIAMTATVVACLLTVLFAI